MSDTSGREATGKVLGDLQAVGDAARQTAQQAGKAGADAVDQAKDVANDAKDRVTSLAGSIGEQAADAAESQKATLADKLEDMAKAVHRSGEQLEGHQDWVAHQVERGAAELSSLASTLRSNDLQSLLGDLGSLARRQPALFVGASMAAGFALARVGRVAVSSSSQQPAPGTDHTSSPSVLPSTVSTEVGCERE